MFSIYVFTRAIDASEDKQQRVTLLNQVAQLCVIALKMVDSCQISLVSVL